MFSTNSIEITTKTLNIILVLVLLLSLLGNMYILKTITSGYGFIVMDSSRSIHVTELATKDELESLYSQLSWDAATAFLQQNPRGVDNLQAFNYMFGDKARAKASKIIEEWKPLFTDYKVHQKVEIEDITIDNAQKERFITNIKGQLVRFFVEDNKAKTYVCKFQMNAVFLLNSNLSTNARYPYFVDDFKFKLETIKGEEK